MSFSPSFALLRNFTVGLPCAPASEQDILAVATYLGVDLAGVPSDKRQTLLASELSKQNEFLSYELSSEAIFGSRQYQRSMFVREVVANNRSYAKGQTARAD